MLETAPRRFTFAVLAAAILGALLVACAAMGSSTYFRHFQPTRGNAKQHYDERGESLDRIEGIWYWERLPGVGENTAIVRDTIIAGYEFVALQLPSTAVTGDSERRRDYRSVVMAFRKTAVDTLYAFYYCDVLGRPMPNQTLEGTVVVKHDWLWFPGASRELSERDARTWHRIYP